MVTRSISDVSEPMRTPNGESIAELVGLASPVRSGRHSVAVITLAPGRASVLHMHPEAEESYFVMRGAARVRVGDDVVNATVGSAVLIEATRPHKIENIGTGDLVFLAVCVPAWERNNTVWLE
jgi:mannose-6-phosphate isomerase-like protein (cupin superfamily)